MNAANFPQATFVKIFLGLTIFVTSVSQAGAQGDSIIIAPHWKKGEKHHYIRTKARLKKRNEIVESNVKGQTDLTVDVLSAAENGFELSWVFGDSTTNDPRVKGNPLLKRMNNLVSGLQFKLKIDQDGDFEGMTNIEEVKLKISKVIDFVVDEIGKSKNLPQAQRDQLRRIMNSMILSKKGIEEIMAREPRIFLMALAGEYSLEKPRRFKSKMPLAVGGGEVTVSGEFRLKSLDRKKNLAVITYKQEIDPKEGAQAVMELLKKLAAQTGNPLPPGDPLKQLNVIDTAEFVINTKTGWPERINHTRTAQSFGAMQQDVITFTKKK